jgi:hypothetical protein
MVAAAFRDVAVLSRNDLGHFTHLSIRTVASHSDLAVGRIVAELSPDRAEVLRLSGRPGKLVPSPDACRRPVSVLTPSLGVHSRPAGESAPALARRQSKPYTL